MPVAVGRVQQMSIDESTFETLAEALLRRWSEAVETAGAEAIDADLQSGVLTIEVEGVGTFILNKHAPLKQLWLSSPVSGASHYAFDATERVWRSTRGGDDLATLLEAELEDAAGTVILLGYDA